MSDIWRPSEEENNLIYSFALQNCLEHGQAQMGSIMGKLSKDFDMKKYGRLLPRYVIAQVNKANSLMQREGEEAVRNELMRIDASKFERLEREKVKIERTFPDLLNVKEGNFKVRFAPNPNAPLTVGHMRGVLINNYYADKYGGDFILRFDDTSTDVKPPILDAYVQILEDAYWLTGKAPDEVLIASDRMDIYYDHAQQLISLNGAYMCDCKNFKELKDASQPCPHRQLSIKENLDLFNQMVEGKFPAGKWVLRAKTDLDAPNPAHRDFVLFRVQKNAHPRTGDSYKAWPMLDFQSAIDDNLTGVTHIIRGIDLMDSTEKQKILYNILDWDYPETTYWGRVKILDQDGKEVKFSSSQYAKDIAEGKFDGWDDKRLYTVQAFKKRGYTPDALLEWWLEYGLTRKPITVSMKTLDTLQRRKGKMEAESFEADYYPYTWNTGQKCESCDNGEIMETEHAYKSSTLSCDKCDYSEEMVWDGESCDYTVRGVCDKVALVETKKLLSQGIKNFTIIEGYVWTEDAENYEWTYPDAHTWIELKDGTIIDPSERQYDDEGGIVERLDTSAYDIEGEFYKNAKYYAPNEYLEMWKESIKNAESFEAEEFNAINLSNTTLSTYGRKRHRKFDHKQSKRHDFGMAFCEECGELFMKNHPRRKYCYGDCAKIVQARQSSAWSRKEWANMTDEERQDYYRENLPKKRERRANMTDEQLDERNRKHRERRAKMTDEEKEEYRIKQREYHRKKRANRTDEEKDEYNRKRRERRAKKRELGAEDEGIEYKYALVAKYPDIDLQDFNIPEGLEAIGKNHITIVSGKALKPVKKIVKENKDNLSLLSLPPKPIMGKTGVAIRDIEGEKRETYFMEIANQDEFQDYANLVCASLGIENPEPKRFFHLSVANNQGGDSFKSVGDIKLEDLSGEN